MQQQWTGRWDEPQAQPMENLWRWAQSSFELSSVESYMYSDFDYELYFLLSNTFIAFTMYHTPLNLLSKYLLIIPATNTTHIHVQLSPRQKKLLLLALLFMKNQKDKFIPSFIIALGLFMVRNLNWNWGQPDHGNIELDQTSLRPADYIWYPDVYTFKFTIVEFSGIRQNRMGRKHYCCYRPSPFWRGRTLD